MVLLEVLLEFDGMHLLHLMLNRSCFGITLVYRSMVRNEITGYYEIHVVQIRN